MQTPTAHMLPDLLVPDLRLVFVGTAAGRMSADKGEYYAHPGNRFWRALSETGITPRLYKSSEWRDLVRLGIGFTDMAKTAAGVDKAIHPSHYDVARFNDAMRMYRPRAIAFTSKRAASVWLGRSSTKGIAFGRQAHSGDDLPVAFVLPSPSGLATSYWDLEPWRELAAWFHDRAGRGV